MAEIKHSVHIQAPAARVYDALIRQDQLSQWWAHCQTEGREGGQLFFEFDSGNYVRFKILKMVAAKKVIWQCTEHNFNGNHDFAGTTIEYTLTPKAAGTQVDFVQRDWRADSESFDLCDIGWEHFITVSLKCLVERGQGQPHDVATPAIMERASRAGKLKPAALLN